MSGEDFIYSAITDDNVSTFDLNVIASKLTSTDKLVRENKQQQEENDRLRKKISSLRETALEIKNLYEAECAKSGRIEEQLATALNQCRELEKRCSEAENDRVNTGLLLKERIAEYDRQIETDEARYRAIVCDLVRYFSHDQQQGAAQPSCDRWKELKVHAGTAKKLDLPEEVRQFFSQNHPPAHASSRGKRKKRPDACDQECQTSDEDTGEPVRMLRTSGTNTDVPYPAQRVEPVVEKKTFCDKGTMHSTMSTITRSTCTSAFIKRVDVGVNFPEITHKSVDEILRECVPLPPLLLSPIVEILPLRRSVEIQTERSAGEDQNAPIAVEKPQLVSCSTMTSLKNIRKRIDYRKTDGGGPPAGVERGGGGGIASFQQQYINIAEQLYAKKIKKEEQMSSVGFGQDENFGRMHPHLSTIWTLLGETIFSLMGSPGRRFDGQCYSMINEQLATIRDMIEADGRRESELMSAMFSNVSATVEAAAGYGKQRVRLTRVPPEQDAPQSAARCFPADGCRAAAPPVGNFVGHCSHVRQADNLLSPVVAEDIEPVHVPPSPTNTPIVPPCPTGQTKDINEVVSASTTPKPTTATPQTNGQSFNASVQMENEQMETDVAPSTDGEIKRSEAARKTVPQVMDVENDRIAEELRQMEEGEDDTSHPPDTTGHSGVLAGPITPLPEESPVQRLLVAGPTISPTTERIEVPSLRLAPASERPSTPPRAPETNTTSTATFVSPIKVKETNDLVKDQFKTPTQPPISKRKLRIRRSGEPPAPLPPSYSPKRQRLDTPPVHTSDPSPPPASGRISPTTEFLLEDDWDQKFSSIKAAMFSPIEGPSYRPLSPIVDRIELDDEDGEGMVLENEGVEEEDSKQGKEKEDPKEREAESGSLVEAEPVEIVPTIVRIENGKGNDEPAMEKLDDSSKADESVPMDNNDRPSPECTVVPIETIVTDPVSSGESRPEEPSALDEKTSKESDKIVEQEPTVDVKEKVENVPNVGKVSELESPASPDWDSPMSPPAHETGIETAPLSTSTSTSTSESVYCLDSPLSPPPATTNPVDVDTSVPPPRVIPLDHIHLHRCQQRARGPLDQAIESYKTERRADVVNAHAGRMTDEEQSALQQMTEVLKRYVKSPWTEASVAEAVGKVVAISHEGRMIARAVLETAVAHHGDLAVNIECSPPAPPIPVTQQKLVLLVRHLTPHLPDEPFDRVMMRELDRRVFQLKAAESSLPGLIALTFLYIGLEDSKPPTVVPWHRTYSVRLYLFKCLYYFGYKCLPLVYYVLRAFPFALPKKGSPNYDNADAMISTIRTILMNTNYNESVTNGGGGGNDMGLYKKRELFALLTYQYGYQPGSPTYDELVVNLIEKIRANRLRNVPHALILVAKRKGYEWARQNIIQKRLSPLLNDYLKLLDLMNGGGGGTGAAGSACPVGDLAGLDERIVACIFTISSIMKTHPPQEDVSGVMQIFTTIVQLARGNQKVQEEAIAGLVKFSRFGHADIFERIRHWQPTYPVSDRIDIDERLLNQNRNMVKPLLVDYVTPSENPFTVEVWRGDISVAHECLKGTDAVIGIEIIEHLHQPVLDKVPENVFGFIKPKVAFFSTPNAEFNVLFDGLLENGFRHDDHKFEWTRAEFEAWASSICQRYPDYDVKYFGIGAPPAGSEAIGCVSQLAVFVRKDFLGSLPDPPVKEPQSSSVSVDHGKTDEPEAGEPSKRTCWFDPEIGEVITDPPPPNDNGDGAEGPAFHGPPGDGAMDEGWRMNDELDIDDQWSSGDDQQEDDIGGAHHFEMYIPDGDEEVVAARTRNDSGNFEEEEEVEPRIGEYWLIHREEYPVAAPDDRTVEQRLRDDVLYQVRRLRNFGEDFLDPEQDLYLIPLYAVQNCMGAEQVTIEQLRRILPAEGYRINADDMVCLPVEYSSDDDVDDCAEYDIDDPCEPHQGWEEDEDKGANGCPPNRAVQGLSLAEDDATWD
ncbi:AGAP005647-PA-like protein [Anopheles sinensis]|uniref:Small RNA 2'-O-methyltransferase n=1 Tax=Anopheles sinensis TaxID=74873 RepID=A0A084WK69_ANOSI|nr:AGAP005647-PA-like protein [Anopheles sinensis]